MVLLPTSKRQKRIGNPVKIGNGCAAVTDDALFYPKSHCPQKAGRHKNKRARMIPKSEDLPAILIVLSPVFNCEYSIGIRANGCDEEMCFYVAPFALLPLCISPSLRLNSRRICFIIVQKYKQ